MSKATPDEYLRQHEINELLKGLDVTDEQKVSARLVTSANAGFSSWPVASKGDWPPNSTIAKRAWCALKWLTLDNPAESTDAVDACKYVQDFLSSKALLAGISHLSNAKKAGAKASAESFVEADKFVETVAALMKKNSRLKRTPAIKAAAKIHGIGVSTGWSYMKKIESKTKK